MGEEAIAGDLGHRLLHVEGYLMNEVRQILGAVQTTVSSASSIIKGVEAKAPVNGNILPESSATTKPVTKPVEQQDDAQEAVNTPRDLEIELQNVNTYVQSIKRDIQFDVDNELATTIIRVVDGDSGEVIRQIPEDIFLELARRLEQDGEIHLFDAIG